jgi:hypothetical protein
LYEAYSNKNTSVENINDEMDSIVEKAKKVLYESGGEYVVDEEIKVRICYPKNEIESNIYSYFFRNRTKIENRNISIQ